MAVEQRSDWRVQCLLARIRRERSAARGERNRYRRERGALTFAPPQDRRDAGKDRYAPQEPMRRNVGQGADYGARDEGKSRSEADGNHDSQACKPRDRLA